MSTGPCLKPKYGLNRTFSRFADPRSRLQLCQWREEAHDLCVSPAASRSMADEERRGRDEGIPRGGQPSSLWRNDAAQMLAEDELHD